VEEKLPRFIQKGIWNMKRSYGWRKDVKLSAHLTIPSPMEVAALPKSIDYRPILPACWDQGQTSGCTGYGTTGAVAFQSIAEKETYVEPSHRFPYYNGRVMEGDSNQDAGARIEDVVASLVKYGYCAESLCPSGDVSTVDDEPSSQAYAAALPAIANVKPSKCTPTINAIKQQLASGFCVIVGMMVYSNMESEAVAGGAPVELPGPNDYLAGGHCVCITGYTDNGYWIVRNSWGQGWGLNGYFLLNELYPLQDSTILQRV
jgi:C1A family cysteine protease